MSASSKLNALLKRQPIDEVVEQLLKHRRNPHQRVPIDMFRKLDARLQRAIPIAHQPLLGNPIAQAEVNLKKADQRAHARAVSLYREAIRRELQASIQRLPGPPWVCLLAKDRHPGGWDIPENSTADQLLQSMVAGRHQWWEAHRSTQTPLMEVLAGHQQDFGWPTRLPATQTLIDLLTSEETLAAPSAQAKEAVKTYLTQIKAQRASERQQTKEERAERALAREQRRQERAAAEAAERTRVARENDHLMKTGYLPDTNPRTWRRLAEVAELVGLSASTLRADLKKNRLAASGYTRGSYMSTATSLHSRPNLRSWIAAWRPALDPALVNRFTAGERLARNKLKGIQHWEEIAASGRLIEGFKVAPPKGWPINVVLHVADSAAQAKAKIDASPMATLKDLDKELAWMADAWQEAISQRALQGRWSPPALASVYAFLAAHPGRFELSWPAGFSDSLSLARVNGLLSDQLDAFARKHPEMVHTLKALNGLELSNPLSWYPNTRRHTRRWLLHLGPTNSGKTHQAMEAMLAAPTGLYLAPLRLMALEGFDRLVSAGKPCALLTGEERKGWIPQDVQPSNTAPQNNRDHLNLAPDEGNSVGTSPPSFFDLTDPDNEEKSAKQTKATHVSATIEAGFDDSRVFDVAVIDEAQMIFDRDRGWAWAQALVGLCAREIHVCAAPEAGPALRRLAERLGIEVDVIQHTRLTPLAELTPPVALNELERGDALVVFSRRQLMGYRSWLRSKGKSVAVIYGDLGPEVRRSEAERFRSGDAEILVSTDAIGMGLNLPIRRVIFADTEKFDGDQHRALRPSEWKQIAGRAGRFGLYDQGLYGRLPTALPFSLSNTEPRTSAGFRPPRPLVQALATWLGWRSVSDAARFWRAPEEEVESSANWGEPGWLNCLAGTALSLDEQYRYLGAPVDRGTLSILTHWVGEHAQNRQIKLPSVPMDIGPVEHRNALVKLEQLAAQIRLYRWCSLTFPDTYPDDASAAQAQLSSTISRTLETMALENLCDSCGCKLPVGHPHANCNPCFEKRQYQGHYDF